MGKRRDDIEETRSRIVEAAVLLHGTVGPAHTTVSAIADSAGVQRSTVYRHFPDDDALFRACTGHWLARHPWPDPGRWLEIRDPEARIGSALDELYAYFSTNQRMLRNSLRDREAMPAFVGAAAAARLEAMHAALMANWVRRGRQRLRLTAAARLALDFRTWESLDAAGLTPSQAAELMTDLAVHCAARGGA